MATQLVRQSRAAVERYSPDGKRIYFIKSGKFIKIGSSADPTHRLETLSTSTPHELTLLGHIAGSTAAELELHKLLGRHRVRSEWFRACAALMRVVDDLLSNPPRPGQPTIKRGWRDIFAEIEARGSPP